MFDLTSRYDFLALAILFEGSLIGIAAALGWWFDVDPLRQFDGKVSGVLWGIAATVPMLALFQTLYARPWKAARRIRELLLDTLGPSLAACRWYDLALLAAVAGLGEEALFRGVLQPLLGLWGSNILFGLLHPVSILYVVLAGGLGAYLGWLLETTENLLAPIVAHGLYDFVAFVLVARDYRRRGLAHRVLRDSTASDTTPHP